MTENETQNDEESIKHKKIPPLSLSTADKIECIEVSLKGNKESKRAGDCNDRK